MRHAAAIVRPPRRGSPVANDRERARLLAALRAQDPNVAEPLFQRFAPLIFRLLRGTLGSPARLECAVAVVLLCVFHRARRLRPRADLGQLILRVTADVARAELRQQTPQSPSFRRGWRVARPVVARGTVREHQAVPRFYRILDGLNAVDWIAFVFHHVEGVEVHDVAAAVGGTISATRRRLERVLRTIHDGIRRDPLLREMRGLPQPGIEAAKGSPPSRQQGTVQAKRP
jgi:DNA-directed RNA polymerase specialized sigma24 family protein